MLHAFSLALFLFELKAEMRLTLHPHNPGNTLRGAFGATFKRLVCPTPADCRETCRMKICPYGQIFEPSPPPGSDRLSLNQDIPRPFVFRPPNGIETTARAGDSLHFDLILIGKALEYFPYFLVTFRELGNQGIGLGRGRYRIARVSQLNEDGNDAAEVYSGRDNVVRPSPLRITYKDCCRLASATPTRRVTIRFLTPTLLKADGAIVRRPEFHHLVKRLRDRLNALAHFYCGDTLDVDFKTFGERAEAVRTVNCHVRWEDRDRRSWKTGLSHDMGGFVGEATYEGDIRDFLPLLILGQYTHVGKYAVWGNGRYEIVDGRSR
ncbi:MAG TPA: CRISPR system precrRNA processing endoribonuclease RAMP protein Cas6 [Nitrospira sp.]|nr:CRISPR system precrRNA processing endoribonuclease RAMP protein Cas6 [Nitrospira sp.]